MNPFGWLIDPISPSEFFETSWELRPLLVKGRSPDYFKSLISLDEIDRVITTLDRRFPDIVLKDARRDLDPADYTVAGGVLDPARVMQLFAEGATITLAFLDTVLPPLTRLCRGLEGEFSSPVQANVYLTPPSAQGAKVHYDTHDVFVLQIEGSKQWTLYDTPVQHPLPGQAYDPALHPCGDPTLRFELQPGDLAYIPCGIMHDAQSSTQVSLHVTIGVLRYSWTDLLLELVAAAGLTQPELRRAIPRAFPRQSFDRTAFKASARRLLELACSDASIERVLGRFSDELMSCRPPPLRGQMAQVMAVQQLTLDSTVGATDGLAFRLLESAQAVSVECFGRRLTFPPTVTEAVRFALQTSRFIVRDLPLAMDEQSKLVLIRRLIREGLVRDLTVGH